MPTKSKSGHPAKRAVSTAKSWKKAKATMELELPSGEVCLVKRPGLPQLIAENVLPDMLTPIANKAIEKGQSGVGVSEEESQEMMANLMKQENGLESMLDSFSRITAHCVVEPPVAFHKRKVDDKWENIPEGERDEDILYTDDVDLEDQMFIFQFVVGGSKDLTEFRRKLGESVERLVDEPGAEKDAS
jgi:hypothetical protein